MKIHWLFYHSALELHQNYFFSIYEFWLCFCRNEEKKAGEKPARMIIYIETLNSFLCITPFQIHGAPCKARTKGC